MAPEATGTEPLVCERFIDASPETVFDFWTDPEKVTRWLAAEATVDPRPGGAYHQVHVDGDGTRHRIPCEFVEVSPPSRLVFTWPAGPSTVEVTLTPEGGGTRLRLVHHDLPAGQRADHEGGWTTHLESLAEAVQAS